jgi:hypothetical protein
MRPSATAVASHENQILSDALSAELLGFGVM